MSSLLACYLVGVALTAIIAATQGVRLMAGKPPTTWIRVVALVGFATLWPLVLVGFTQLLVIRTSARLLVRYDRSTPAPSRRPALAGRR